MARAVHAIAQATSCQLPATFKLISGRSTAGSEIDSKRIPQGGASNAEQSNASHTPESCLTWDLALVATAPLTQARPQAWGEKIFAVRSNSSQAEKHAQEALTSDVWINPGWLTAVRKQPANIKQIHIFELAFPAAMIVGD